MRAAAWVWGGDPAAETPRDEPAGLVDVSSRIRRVRASGRAIIAGPTALTTVSSGSDIRVARGAIVGVAEVFLGAGSRGKHGVHRVMWRAWHSGCSMWRRGPWCHPCLVASIDN